MADRVEGRIAAFELEREQERRVAAWGTERRRTTMAVRTDRTLQPMTMFDYRKLLVVLGCFEQVMRAMSTDPRFVMHGTDPLGAGDVVYTADDVAAMKHLARDLFNRHVDRDADIRELAMMCEDEREFDRRMVEVRKAYYPPKRKKTVRRGSTPKSARRRQ